VIYPEFSNPYNPKYATELMLSNVQLLPGPVRAIIGLVFRKVNLRPVNERIPPGAQLAVEENNA